MKRSIASFAIFMIGLISYAESPKWLTKTNFSSNIITVKSIESVSGVNLFVLSSGLESNLRTGVVCSCIRNNEIVAELIVVESVQDKSVAIALNKSEIQIGDLIQFNIIRR